MILFLIVHIKQLLLPFAKEKMKNVSVCIIIPSSTHPHHRHNCGWWDLASSQSEEQQPITSPFFFSSTTFKTLSKAATWHGIFSTPSCSNPNSSSACLRRSSNARWLKYSVGIMNLFSSSPTHTATNPLGTAPSFAGEEISEKDSVFFRNLLMPLLWLLVLVLGAVASLFHFLRIWRSRTISLILSEFFEYESMEDTKFFAERSLLAMVERFKGAVILGALNSLLYFLLWYSHITISMVFVVVFIGACHIIVVKYFLGWWCNCLKNLNCQLMHLRQYCRFKCCNDQVSSLHSYFIFLFYYFRLIHI